MSSICPTVKIKSDNEGGHTIINESDFDSSKHEIYEVPAPAESDVPPPPAS